MTKSITFEVIGDQRLVCEGCEQRIERLLKALAGVRQVRAEAQNQRVEVLFDTAVLEPTAIAERLGEVGYETRVGSSIAAHLEVSMKKNPTKGKNWLRSLAMIPGALLPLLPSATCPVCAAAYAGLFSAVGLGFLFREQVLAPLIVVFLMTGILTVAWSTSSHRRPGPLLATLLGSAAVVAGRLVWNIQLVMYSGAALLIAAVLWNLWLKRLNPKRLVTIRPPTNERAPQSR